MCRPILTDNPTLGEFGFNEELICMHAALSNGAFPIYCYLWKRWIFINI